MRCCGRFYGNFGLPCLSLVAGGKGRAAFCHAPAIPKDVPRDARKSMDYSEYPLTTHGELLFALVQSGMSAYPHKSVALQFFETVSRYSDFFKVRKECIVPILEAMIDTRSVPLFIIISSIFDTDSLIAGGSIMKTLPFEDGCIIFSIGSSKKAGMIFR